MAMKEPKIAMGPPKIAARKYHLEMKRSWRRVRKNSAHLPSTPVHNTSHNTTEIALNMVMTAADIRNGPVCSTAMLTYGASYQMAVPGTYPVSYTHLRAHETDSYL